MVRLTEGIPDGAIAAGLNLQHYYAKAFENIGTAKVATSAMEAMDLGLHPEDGEHLPEPGSADL